LSDVCLDQGTSSFLLDLFRVAYMSLGRLRHVKRDYPMFQLVRNPCVGWKARSPAVSYPAFVRGT
jgi:hypothetical protein